MKYQIGFKPGAVKDLKLINKKDAYRIIEKIEIMQCDLRGDVKKLTNFTPEYRLRVGKYRVLFEVTEGKVIIYRIKHRKDSYI
ncbi:MAG: type II toxin-antitoxin system RelE/ParE family toxin [bacterium]|nr:type II toxin-antitoxin system RelE/ParE family toxin [bacterium]